MLKAKLLKIDELIDEEVLIEINGVRLVVLATVCPYKIMPNTIYPVDLCLTDLDGFEVRELDEEEYGAERISDAYAYILKGQVVGDCLDIGHDIKIQDDYFKEYSYLNGKFVSVKVDRLDVWFL